MDTIQKNTEALLDVSKEFCLEVNPGSEWILGRLAGGDWIQLAQIGTGDELL
jgi:hypothetical protein